MAKENANGEDVPYASFNGIVLTDTFQLYEQDKDMIADVLPDNSERRTAQKERDIRVIVGNPPYSAGQTSANDNAANISYENLDSAIRDTYAANSKAILKNALYDSYIRAIRWATDRIKDKGNDRGVVAFVSNAGWINGNATDGMRKCLTDEFSSLYVFHLRGNARTDGEQRRKERGNVFGEGTRTPIAITILVRNPEAAQFGKIYFHDIGDYLDQKEKLSLVRTFKSIEGLAVAKGWEEIEPDENFVWISQGEKAFGKYAVMGDRTSLDEPRIFEKYSGGAKTNRDAWCFNFDKKNLARCIQSMMILFNSELNRWQEQTPPNSSAAKFVVSDPKRISWNRSLLKRLERGEPQVFDASKFVISQYRPFTTQWLYFDRSMISDIGKTPTFFPATDQENLVISIVGRGEAKDFSVLLSSMPTEYKTLYNGQCFPLKLYEPANPDDGLFTTGETGYKERDGISDAGLKHFRSAYPGEQINKEDLFYYIYGLLHSPDYRERFKNNLSKEVPRIPAVKTAIDFWAFSKAGRALGDLHVDYETVEPYPVTIKQGDLRLTNIADPEKFYRVEKMKFAGKRPNLDKSTVIYNANITVTDIPLEAYDYVVNGKPALDWVMERQCVKTDKASGIVNDANCYAIETMDSPAYPLELFQRVITVSLETMKIVNSLPKLDID